MNSAEILARVYFERLKYGKVSAETLECCKLLNIKQIAINNAIMRACETIKKAKLCE